MFIGWGESQDRLRQQPRRFLPPPFRPALALDVDLPDHKGEMKGADIKNPLYFSRQTAAKAPDLKVSWGRSVHQLRPVPVTTILCLFPKALAGRPLCARHCPGHKERNGLPRCETAVLTVGNRKRTR